MGLKKYLATGLIFFYQLANAAPSINIQSKFYLVAGNDFHSIQRSIQKNGPVGKNGKRFHAVTQWKARWSYRWFETGSLCQLTSVEVSIDVEYILPELTDVDEKSEIFKKSWDKYFQALFKHEQKHKDNGVLAVFELEKELLAIKNRQTCSALENQVTETAQKVLDKYDLIEKELDRVTNHGLNQGVKLP